MATINNLKEFFEARGFEMEEMEENSMWYYGRCLYKYTFGPWVSYTVLESPEKTTAFEILIEKGKENGLPKLTLSKNVTPELSNFFQLKGLEENSFDEYARLVIEYREKHETKWDAYLQGGRKQLFIKGDYIVPQVTRDIYYEDDEAHTDTLKLADQCLGITVGSIIEGCDYDATPFYRAFPFEEKDFDTRLDELSDQVTEEWEKCNSTYYSVMHRETKEKELWCQWVQFDDEPRGNWAEDDGEMEKLATAAGKALFDNGYLGGPYDIPGYPDYQVLRDVTGIEVDQRKERTMNRYDSRNMPGPGDEATWGPYTGHPLDPRRPDDEQLLEEKAWEMAQERVKDSLDWVAEAITEAEYETQRQLWQAYLDDDKEAVFKVLDGMFRPYIVPSEEEVRARLNDEALWDE